MHTWTNGPGTNPFYYRIWRITPAFRPLKQQVIGSVTSVLWVVMATVGLVMLIACMNVANLLLVRADSRRHEFRSAPRWERAGRALHANFCLKVSRSELSEECSPLAWLVPDCACLLRWDPQICRD